MSKIERVCSTCKHYPSDEHCKGCTFDWKNANGNTHWELEELDFSTPKKVVGNLISADVLDKIAEEIAKLPTYIIQNGDPYSACEFKQSILKIINKYRKEQE